MNTPDIKDLKEKTSDVVDTEQEKFSEDTSEDIKDILEEENWDNQGLGESFTSIPFSKTSL